MSWQKLCRSKPLGGLGVRDLDIFSRVLLGKWLWIIATDQGALWVKVVSLLYGNLIMNEDGITVVGNSSKWSGWWLGIIENGDKEADTWFRHHIFRKIGDSANTFFWDDLWIGDQLSKHSFPRLYNLSLMKGAKVNEMGNWINGSWVWEFIW